MKITDKLKPEELPYYLTVEEAQRFLRISQSACYYLVNSGGLEAKKIGRRWFIPRDQFLRPQVKS